MMRQQASLLPTQDGEGDWINLAVCRRMKTKRILSNMSQERLAKGLGISYQQLQRYESGKSRLPSSMLYRASVALGVPVGYFFETIEQDRADGGQTGGGTDHGLDKSHLLAVKNIQDIRDGDTRQSLLRLIGELADASRAGK